MRKSILIPIVLVFIVSAIAGELDRQDCRSELEILYGR